MADPEEYDSENTPSRKAARAALGRVDQQTDQSREAIQAAQAQLGEEIPEDMPDARVESPATVTGSHYEDRFGSRVPEGLEDLTQHTRVDPPMADIVQSPRAAEGGPGETMAEIRQTAETASDAAAAAEVEAEAALGEDIDLDYAKRLLAMSEGGVIGELPPEVIRLLRKFISLSDKMTAYDQASALAAKEME
tara:strand:+ start:4369 stop:4947 length:579 start_codon:yes stop_codon:yes gene_type:complete